MTRRTRKLRRRNDALYQPGSAESARRLEYYHYHGFHVIAATQCIRESLLKVRDGVSA